MLVPEGFEPGTYLTAPCRWIFQHTAQKIVHRGPREHSLLLVAVFNRAMFYRVIYSSFEWCDKLVWMLAMSLR